MKIEIGTKGNCVLTNETEGSVPVLYVGETAYRCDDILQGDITAGQMIAKLYNRGAISGDLVTAFIAQLRVL